MMEAVLFDLDGTLLNRALTFRGFLERQFSRLPEILGSVPRSEYVQCAEEFDGHGYSSRQDTFQEVALALSLPPGAAERLLNDFERSFPDQRVPFLGLRRMLIRLRNDDIRTGLVTNGSSKRQRRKVSMLGLERLMDTVIISEEIGLRKPDAAIFEAALDRLGVPLAHAMHVGDHPDTDINGARRCGLFTVWKRNRIWPRPTTADAVIDSLDEIVPLVLP